MSLQLLFSSCTISIVSLWYYFFMWLCFRRRSKISNLNIFGLTRPRTKPRTIELTNQYTMKVVRSFLCNVLRRTTLVIKKNNKNIVVMVNGWFFIKKNYKVRKCLRVYTNHWHYQVTITCIKWESVYVCTQTTDITRSLLHV